MALIKCTECGQDISTEATVCPHCGKPSKPIVHEIVDPSLPKKGTAKAIIGFLILGLIFLAVAALTFSASVGAENEKMSNDCFRASVMSALIAIVLILLYVGDQITQAIQNGHI